MKEDINILYKSYEFFISHRNNRVSWQCAKSDRNDKLLLNFYRLLKKEGFDTSALGIEWLFRFTSFQFSRYQPDHRIPLTKIFGKKAYDKWCGRKSYWDIYATRNVYSHFNITFNDFVTYCTNAKTQLIRDSSDDVHKKIHHNTDLGFARCLEYTTLYTRTSKWCMTCRYQEQCKDALKQTYPIIYKQRKL